MNGIGVREIVNGRSVRTYYKIMDNKHDDISDEELQRFSGLDLHAVQLTKLSSAKLKEMFDVLNVYLDPSQVWDTNQQADVLREAGYTKDEVNDFFEENASF